MKIRKFLSKAVAVMLSVCTTTVMLSVSARRIPSKSFISASAATDDATYKEFTYRTEGGAVTITGCVNNSGDAWKDRNLTIPDKIDNLPVTAIEGGIYACTINIPSSVTSIEPEGLWCRKFQVSDDNEYFCSVDGVIFSKDQTVLIRYPNQNVGGYTIPETVKTVGDYSFSGCGKSLYYINIPDSVETLGENAFTSSYGFHEVIIPKSVKTIKKQCFATYGELYSITILNPKCEIASDAFAIVYDKATIYGYSGSTAELLIKNSLNLDWTFKLLDDYAQKVRLLYPQKKNDINVTNYSYYLNDLNDLLKKTPPTSYNPELANMLCVMAQSAYDQACVEANYNELGFDTYDAYDYNTTYTQADNCGYVIGYQDLPDGTREYLITVRGTANELTELNGTEWWSDFNIGYSQLGTSDYYPKYHHGFYVAAERIWNTLKKYNNDTIRTDKVRYILTGHSRGAAVSNMISAWLINEGVKSSSLYSYNFACPDVAIADESYFLDSRMYSIFNLNCSRDLVGQVPGLTCSLYSGSAWRALIGDIKYWSKYGQTFFWDVDWDSTLPADVIKLKDYHPCDTNYIPFFSWEYPISDFKYYSEMISIQQSHLWSWDKVKKVNDYVNVVHATIRPLPNYISASALDNTTVNVTDKDGKIVGTVKDNKVTIEKEYENKVKAQVVDDHVDISIDAESGYQISVQSDAPSTIAIAQENAVYSSINNGAVYTPSAGNTTIDIKPDVPAAETPVTDDSGKAIAPDKIWNLGDANSDGKVNVADAVVFQKWLLNIPDSGIADWTAADIYEDGELNVYDLILMKRIITE